MLKSSATQRTFDLGDSGQESVAQPTTFQSSNAGSASVNESSVTSFPFKLPSFGVLGEVYAVESRRAGRLNAANISEEEQTRLLKQREELLTKKFSGNISKAELNTLEYVRWSLDRIDDSKYGETLDRLEALVEGYEKYNAHIESVLDELRREIAKKSQKVRR